MNRMIYKYQLAMVEEQMIDMPEGANIISVANQYGAIRIWAEVDIDNKLVPRKFIIRGTGHTLNGEGRFIGTVLCNEGGLVWHIYEGVGLS